MISHHELKLLKKRSPYERQLQELSFRKSLNLIIEKQIDMNGTANLGEKSTTQSQIEDTTDHH